MASTMLSRATKVDSSACHKGIELKNRPLMPKVIQMPEQKAWLPTRRIDVFMVCPMEQAACFAGVPLLIPWITDLVEYPDSQSALQSRYTLSEDFDGRL